MKNRQAIIELVEKSNKSEIICKEYNKFIEKIDELFHDRRRYERKAWLFTYALISVGIIQLHLSFDIPFFSIASTLLISAGIIFAGIINNFINYPILSKRFYGTKKEMKQSGWEPKVANLMLKDVVYYGFSYRLLSALFIIIGSVGLAISGASFVHGADSKPAGIGLPLVVVHVISAIINGAYFRCYRKLRELDQEGFLDNYLIIIPSENTSACCDDQMFVPCNIFTSFIGIGCSVFGLAQLYKAKLNYFYDANSLNLKDPYFLADSTLTVKSLAVPITAAAVATGLFYFFNKASNVGAIIKEKIKDSRIIRDLEDNKSEGLLLPAINL